MLVAVLTGKVQRTVASLESVEFKSVRVIKIPLAHVAYEAGGNRVVDVGFSMAAQLSLCGEGVFTDGALKWPLMSMFPRHCW